MIEQSLWQVRRLARQSGRVFSNWWWAIDRPLFVAVLILIGASYVVSLASSPLMATKIGLPMYHFAARQIVFLSMALGLCVGLSFLRAQTIVKLSLLVFVGSLLGLVAVLLWGQEVRGAQRWLRIFGFSVQPSEFLKPAFIIISAMLLAQVAAHRLSLLWPFGLLGLCGMFLLAQPDVGQAMLLALCWLGMMFLAGGSPRLLAGLGGGVGLLLVVLYHTMPHVQLRIDTFLYPTLNTSYQTEQALAAIVNGGVFGTGLGDGYHKAFLPDAHTDYVFAVLAEEGGLITGGVVIGLFAFIALRALLRARHAPLHWMQLSLAGLAGLFALQVGINLAVNLNLIPSKGMALPFLSYGGSSLLASGFLLGCILALTRRPIPAIPKPPAVIPQREVLT